MGPVSKQGKIPLSHLFASLYNAVVRLRRWIQPEILIVLLALIARTLPGPRTVDDAYITYRYAQNLLTGNGMVYNPGEAVLGTTTPVYTVLLAGLGLFSGGPQADFPVLSLIFNALADTLTCWLLVRLGTTFGSRPSGLAAALVWAIAPWSVTFAIGGMETSLFVLLMTGTFYMHSKGKPVEAAFLASIALLTRPDALLFILPILLERIRRGLAMKKHDNHSQPITGIEVIVFCLPLLIWGVIGTYVYGNPIPHSIMAKVAAYRLTTEAGLIRLLQHYATPFLGHIIFDTWWIGVGLLLYPSLFLLGALIALRKDRGVWPLFAYPWIYLAAFAIANPLIFRWYLTPPLPIYFLGIFLGSKRIGDDLKSRLPTLILAGFAISSTLSGWTFRPDHGPHRPAPSMAYIQLELVYRQVAEVLQDQIGPGQTLAAGDIGALGYYTGARILDTLGLISPQSLSYYPIPDEYYVINYAIPPELVVDLQPDYLVILEVYGRNGLLIDQTFQELYSQQMNFPTDIYGSKNMLVFKLAANP